MCHMEVWNEWRWPINDRKLTEKWPLSLCAATIMRTDRNRSGAGAYGYGLLYTALERMDRWMRMEVWNQSVMPY